MSQVEGIEAVGNESSSRKSQVLTLGDFAKADTRKIRLVNTVSYAMIVLEILNKVGMAHQQKVMQIRGQYMNVLTKMQNDFTTISQYLSQVENNAHSAGAGAKGIHDDTLWGPNAFNGLDNKYYSVDADVGMSDGNHGDDGVLQSISEAVSTSFKTSTQGFVNAVKDLFLSSPSAGAGQISVADITKIKNPYGGPDFSFMGHNKNYTWDTLGSTFEKQYGISNLIADKPGSRPSLFQQYMYYKAQLQVYTMPKSKVMAAKGDISQLVNFDPTNSNSSDPLEQSFTELLTSLNQQFDVNRNGQMSMVNKSAPSLLKLIDEGKYNCVTVTGDTKDEKWHSGAKGPAGTDHHHVVHYNNIDPGIYMAVSMMSFDYFWTKNPNASTANTNNIVVNGGFSYSEVKGSPEMDPLSNIYMTNNSVQTNIGQQSSQSNNNFQSDVNVASQLDNMGVNSIKSFFEGNSTMNRNSRIS